MKKLMSLCVLLLCAILAKAQGLGDYMEIDGVPGFVFYVDETGEHGLVMSFPMTSEKNVKKMIKKGLLTEEKAKKICPAYGTKEKGKADKGASKDYREDLVSILGEDGEQNKLALIDYCAEKDLDIDIFPGQAFAAHLGNDWFIPGDKELTLFAEFFIGGLGEDNRLKAKDFYKRGESLSNDPAVQLALTNLTIYALIGSTVKDGKWGFRGLVHYSKTGMVDRNWLELREKVKTTKVSYGSVEKATKYRTAAVHKF